MNEVTLAAKLPKQERSVERQVPISIDEQGPRFDERFRADLIVEGRGMVELKFVEKVHAAHKKQVLTSLHLTRMRHGYLLNFGEALMKDGNKRVVCGE